MQKRFVSEKDLEAEAQRKAQQSSAAALWSKVRAGSDEMTHDTTPLDLRPLHERLKENQEKALAQREELLHDTVFQAPRVYNDEEMRFLAEQEASQRIKELEIQQQLSEFDALAEQHRQLAKSSESESTLKILTAKRSASSPSSMFQKTTSKKRRHTAIDDSDGSVKKPKLHDSSNSDNHGEDNAEESLAALIGY